MRPILDLKILLMKVEGSLKCSVALVIFDFQVSTSRRQRVEVREAEDRREIKYCLSNFIFLISNFRGRKGRSAECRLRKDMFSAKQVILVVEEICSGQNDCYSDV